MRSIIKTTILTITLLFSLSLLSQRADPAAAKEHFKFGNHIDALKVYVKLMAKDPRNVEYPYKAGLCVLFTDRDKTEAVKYLEKAAERKSDPDVYFYLGKSYHHVLKLDEALDAFQKYQSSGEGTKQKEVIREIETVINAQKQVLAPIDIVFENVGRKINTKYPDYYPFVTPNESFLIFTSRRSGPREFDGYTPSSIYYTKVVDGEFETAKKGNIMINSLYDDQAVGLSYNGDKLFIYFDDIKNKGDIYESKIVNFRFKKKVKIGPAVNSKGFESAATISADGNTLFFASSRTGGFGGKDIYMTRKLPNGEWGNPQNLGDIINTTYNEDFPNLFYDGTTLYFSSEGHNSLGGYDYFKSNWNATTNTWSKPENIGYPLNTPDDNICISFTKDKRHAYVSAWREDSYGEKDIYKVTFNKLDPRQTVVKTRITAEGASKAITNATILVTNNRTQEEFGNYLPNHSTGKFILSLVPGSYNIRINAPGYSTKNETLIIYGKSDFILLLDKTFELSP